MNGIMVKCDCGYTGIRWNDNLICSQCGGLMRIVGREEKKEVKDKYARI